MSQFPPQSAGPMMMKPHRGVMVLVFGILGLVVCGIFAILAWIFGNSDLKEMDAGRMDPSGRGLTQAGRICGIVGTILQCIGLIIGVLFVILGALGAAAGARGHP